MKKVKSTIFASFAAMALTAAPTLAQQAEGCSLGQIETKRGQASDTDGGTRANAKVTAVIQADPGSFIWGPSVSYSNAGSRSARATSANVTPHPSVKDKPILHRLVLSKATFTATCYDVGRLGDASCTATANISGTQYPMGCRDALVTEKLKEELGG